MDELDERIKKALKGRSKKDKEIVGLIKEALKGSEPLDYDTLSAVLWYLDQFHHAATLIRLMRTGVVNAVYVGGKRDPGAEISIDDYLLYLAEDTEKAKKEDPRIKKRLEEIRKVENEM